MKIIFEKYNPFWKEQFESIKSELEKNIGLLHPIIEHIGSTSVEGLSAKPIIDIMIGVKDESELDKVPPLLQGKDYVYYQKYNEDMPYRRFFIKLTDQPHNLGFPEVIYSESEIPEELHNHRHRIAHIHTIPVSSEHWLRHIAFRDYLRTHPEIREEYQQLKEKLSTMEWFDGNDYNEGKDPFIKREEKKAVQWYLNNKKLYTLPMRDLKEIASQLAKSKTLNDFIEYGRVAAAIKTADGNVYTGISIDTACSMGFCAEHSAVAEMLKNGEHYIKAVVAVGSDGNAVPPCGRCRELMSQLSKENLNAVIEVKNDIFVTLKELMPYDWKEDLGREW